MFLRHHTISLLEFKPVSSSSLLALSYPSSPTRMVVYDTTLLFSLCCSRYVLTHSPSTTVRTVL